MSGLFPSDRQALRQFYLDAWQKHLNKKIVSPLEAQIIEIINLHPEYQAMMTDHHLDKDYLPGLGEINPFLHMSLHLAIREQINTDRPSGIQAIYQQLCQQAAALDVEHQMFEILAESLRQAQVDNKEPDEQLYLQQLRNLIKQ